MRVAQNLSCQYVQRLTIPRRSRVSVCTCADTRYLTIPDLRRSQRGSIFTHSGSLGADVGW